MYVIISYHDSLLFWSNDNGWGQVADIFSQDERDTLNLPLDGEWREIILKDPLTS